MEPPTFTPTAFMTREFMRGSTAVAGGTGVALSHGIDNSYVMAGARSGGNAAGDYGTGTIGDVSGIGHANATGYTSFARGYGINRTTVIAADGDFGVGQVGNVS